MKQPIRKYGGVIIGSLYGLAMRFLFEIGLKFDFADLFSVTFIWIVPIIIGITPMLFATDEQLASPRYRLTLPALTVCLFFLICFITRLEDILCIAIIAIPFILSAAIGGLIFAEILQKYKKNKKNITYSIFFIPILAGLAESELPTPTNVYEIKTTVVIENTPDNIWENIIRVKLINESEYQKGFFNYAGIPRPLFAELDKDTIGATRIGHFEGGLTFQETVSTWERNQQIAFNIKIIPASIRKTIFDQHILKGNHFKFLQASYQLKPIDSQKTTLILASSYQLDSKINGYGSFWGNQLLTDFQQRLLDVIQKRCEAHPK
jgi:hypothetical protein